MAADARRSLRPIGAVVADLSTEFPDLTASKIRFLESEGLVRPARTSGGTRRYSAHDVDRLRRILRLQRDAFLPLRVISEQLDVPADPGEGVDPGRLRRGRAATRTREQICTASGIEPAVFDELVSYGVVTGLNEVAEDICRVVVRLARFGIEPRHLRSLRVAADRERGLVDQVLAPLEAAGPGADARVRAAEARTELLAALVDLHIALLRDE